MKVSYGFQRGFYCWAGGLNRMTGMYIIWRQWSIIHKFIDSLKSRLRRIQSYRANTSILWMLRSLFIFF